MLEPDTVLQPHPSLVFTRLDDTEAVLLHLDTTRYYTLNETGSRIWELLQEGRSAREITQGLQEEYTLTDEEAVPVLLGFMEELRQEGLVRPGAP